MIDTVVSVKLPIGEMLRIKRNRLMPDVVTGEEKRICLVSGIYGDELGGQVYLRRDHSSDQGRI